MVDVCVCYRLYLIAHADAALLTILASLAASRLAGFSHERGAAACWQVAHGPVVARITDCEQPLLVCKHCSIENGDLRAAKGERVSR